MPALVEVERGGLVLSRHGVTARELLELRAESRRWITPTALEAWLVESGFAEPNGEPGRLVPTQRAFEIVGLLDFLD